MSEYEVYARLDGEVDVNIDFSIYTDKDKKKLIERILFGETVTFEEVYVELEGDTTVEVEPTDYN